MASGLSQGGWNRFHTRMAHDMATLNLNVPFVADSLTCSPIHQVHRVHSSFQSRTALKRHLRIYVGRSGQPFCHVHFFD